MSKSDNKNKNAKEKKNKNTNSKEKNSLKQKFTIKSGQQLGFEIGKQIGILLIVLIVFFIYYIVNCYQTHIISAKFFTNICKEPYHDDNDKNVCHTKSIIETLKNSWKTFKHIIALIYYFCKSVVVNIQKGNNKGGAMKQKGGGSIPVAQEIPVAEVVARPRTNTSVTSFMKKISKFPYSFNNELIKYGIAIPRANGRWVQKIIYTNKAFTKILSKITERENGNKSWRDSGWTILSYILILFMPIIILVTQAISHVITILSSLAHGFFALYYYLSKRYDGSWEAIGIFLLCTFLVPVTFCLMFLFTIYNSAWMFLFDIYNFILTPVIDIIMKWANIDNDDSKRRRRVFSSVFTKTLSIQTFLILAALWFGVFSITLSNILRVGSHFGNKKIESKITVIILCILMLFVGLIGSGFSVYRFFKF